MSNDFHRTLQSLESESRTGWLALSLLGFVMLALWTVWFCKADTRALLLSEQGRLEVTRAPHRVATETAGQVLRASVSLGQSVARGAVLLVLDSRAEQLELDEARARQHSLDGERAALRSALTAEQHALVAHRAATRAARSEGELVRAQSEREVAYADEEARTFASILHAGAVAGSEVRERARTLARKRNDEQLLTRTLRRESWERRVGEHDRLAHAADLERQQRELDGKLEALTQRIATLELEIGRRTVLAPLAGRVGQLQPLHPGAVLERGAFVATIVPDSALKMVAQFRASDALGRLRAGQAARLRLDGFSWTEYGTVAARVARVALEGKDGQLTVELVLTPGARAPLQHGLSGSVEVEVERASPLLLVLRSMGMWLRDG